MNSRDAMGKVPGITSNTCQQHEELKEKPTDKSEPNSQKTATLPLKVPQGWESGEMAP